MSARQVFASNLRMMRKARGLSQEELAHAAEVDRTYISSLERMKYSPTLDMVDKLAAIVGVKPHEMLVPHDVSPSNAQSEQ